MAPRALPVSGISECIACASAAEGGGSLLLASSSNAATFAARIEESAPLLSKLLHVPTLWSVLAMSSIVTLLVAWEEAVEVRRGAKRKSGKDTKTAGRLTHLVTIDSCLVTWKIIGEYFIIVGTSTDLFMVTNRTSSTTRPSR